MTGPAGPGNHRWAGASGQWSRRPALKSRGPGGRNAAPTQAFRRNHWCRRASRPHAHRAARSAGPPRRGCPSARSSPSCEPYDAPSSVLHRVNRSCARSETDQAGLGVSAGRPPAARGDADGSQHLSLHLAAQREVATAHPGDDPRLVPVSLRHARAAQAHRQRCPVGAGRAPSVRDAVRPGRLSVPAVRPVPDPRPDQRRLQIRHQRLRGHRRRTHAAPAALRAVLARAALPSAPFPAHLARRDRADDQCRGRAARRLHRRGVRAAGVSGRHAAHRPGVHIRAGPGHGLGRDRALPVPDLRHSQAAAPGEPARQGARAPGAPPRRSHCGNRRRGARHPGQRHHAIRARALHPRARRRLQHPLPDLQKEVLHQVPQQLHGAARPVLFLFDRRLSGDHGRPHAGRPGRGGRRPQGALFAVEGAAQPLPAHLGLADQVRAGGRAVRPRRAARRGAAERGSDRGGAAHGTAARHQSDAHLGGRSAAAGWRQLRGRAARARRHPGPGRQRQGGADAGARQPARPRCGTRADQRSRAAQAARSDHRAAHDPCGLSGADLLRHDRRQSVVRTAASPRPAAAPGGRRGREVQARHAGSGALGQPAVRQRGRLDRLRERRAERARGGGAGGGTGA